VHRAYKLGAVPGRTAYPYAVLALDSGTPNGRTADAKAGRVYRLTVQMFGREADAVTDLARIADEAFEGVALDRPHQTPRSAPGRSAPSRTETPTTSGS
jgi:hypothetical protein